jgi:hypothetical protein
MFLGQSVALLNSVFSHDKQQQLSYDTPSKLLENENSELSRFIKYSLLATIQKRYHIQFNRNESNMKTIRNAAEW